ncbi:hypothetical protein M514_06751 [Trichuris suis]|uniref:Uncharacterized protein n=1 Tax=Trichuris suis TaxID=68888 RepID=A0A085NKF6_9BILA|nr:hypothetical protein M513_06751 [Trichuris suis]KFD69952.1 hypothetical protein M514_06751 [Trichuris suis]
MTKLDNCGLLIRIILAFMKAPEMLFLSASKGSGNCLLKSSRCDVRTRCHGFRMLDKRQICATIDEAATPRAQQ